MDGRDVGEELDGRRDRHRQHVGDGAAAVEHVERRPVEALAVASRARHGEIGHELQRHLQTALALALLAPAAADIEAEAIRLVAADLGQPGRGENLADFVEDAGIGGRC